MAIFSRGGRWVIGLGLLGTISTAAVAQENLDAGKSGAQLFGSNCAICHKLPDVLAKSGGVLGIESFLREHYTASRESAAMIANYLKSAEKEPAPARTRTTSKRAKGEDKIKSDKSGVDKSPGGKSGEAKETNSNASEKAADENSKLNIMKPEKTDQTKSEKANSPKQSGDAKPAQAD